MVIPNALVELNPSSFGRPSDAAQANGTGTHAERLVDQTRLALKSAADRLLNKQRPDGHWCAELEGDTILESEYAILLAFLGRLGDARIKKCADYIISQQQPHGGWSIYPGGPLEISSSVKAYLTLKMAGHLPDEPIMQKARLAILDAGGAELCNSYTRFALASLGLVPYTHCPTVPPELCLLPNWFPISLYRMSSWTRSIVVPLSIYSAYKPVNKLPDRYHINELFKVPPSAHVLPKVAQIQGRLFSWSNMFRLLDRGLKLYERTGIRFIRRRAIESAKKWMIDHFEKSDGVGAIFPPMIYTLVALKCLGYPEDSPEFKWAEEKLDELKLEDERGFRYQPCFSPIWDTAWSMLALRSAGLPADHPALVNAARWTLAREIREPGDWKIFNGHLTPSGWAFEYNNKFYPDLDDTAIVLLALKQTSVFDEPACKETTERALKFLEGMRCSDGGWAAFDRDINNPVLEQVPFADHNAMLDPSCPDITGRVLEMYGHVDKPRAGHFLDKALNHIFSHQEPEGCWFGRWGVNYIYGTWQVLNGLASIGYDMKHPRVRRAVDWLLSVQQSNGGWGETCETYADRKLMGQGKTTASQTAWAVSALISAGEGHSAAVRRGVEYLVQHQRSDGGWDEPEYTGTGFPKVFYLKYHDYALYFPILALAKYVNQFDHQS